MFPSKHLAKQYLFNTWPCPSWDGLWAFVGFGLLGLGLYLLQRLTRKTLNVKANDLVLHYKKPPLPPDEGTIAKLRRRKGAYIAGTLWLSEEIQAMARVRAHFDGADQVNYILNYQLD